MGRANGAPALGDPVVALANPGGRGLRATLGFVSSEGRSFRGPRGRRVEGAIEHTAPLPRGSSGGPLVDPDGRLLGLNSLRLEGGLILAVPATAAVRERASALARGEAAAPRRLGVAVAPAARGAPHAAAPSACPSATGLLVRAVEEGSPADARRHRARRPAGGRRRPRARRRGRAVRGARRRADRGGLELTVVRGTEERRVEVSFEDDGTAA